MKKLTAFIIAMLTLTALTACSSGSSDTASSNDTTTAATTAAPDTSSSDSSDSSTPSDEDWFDDITDTDTPPEFTGEAGEYARSFTERIAEGRYSMQLTVEAQGSRVALKAAYNGDNSRVTMRSTGMDIEVYRLDGELCILIPSMQAYTLQDDALMATVNLLRDYSLDPRAKLISTEEQGSEVIETYGVPAAANTPEGYEFDERIDLTVKYRFDKETGKPIEIVTGSPLTGSSTAAFRSLVFTSEEITLPDLTGWTQLKNGEKPDREQQVKMTMSLLGITEEMLTHAGYTTADLAAMSESQMTEILVDIMEKNGLS